MLWQEPKGVLPRGKEARGGMKSNHRNQNNLVSIREGHRFYVSVYGEI